ncbi:TPA: hypothetical protein ACHVSV_002659, partial [Enterococcus faecium]
MRVDFHIHTQKCKSGDSSKRIINPKDFIKKMDENNVVMCAITNHNKFCKEEFQEIMDMEPNFSIFPGIELDLKIDDKKHYHTIVICDPNEMEHFYETFDNDNNRDYDNFYLEYQDFINKVKEFSSEKIVIIPHFLDKDKKRAFTLKDKEKLLKDLENYIIILEPGKIQTMGIINGHDEISLLGSDVQDWNKYSEYELPEIKFRINSFSKFYELAKNPKQFIKKQLDAAQKIDVVINEKQNTVPIYEDINIVFGEKGAGKTVFMSRYLLPHFQRIGKKVFLHEGKNYNTEYENIIKKYKDSVEADEYSQENIRYSFDKVIGYNEDSIPNFIQSILEYHKATKVSANALLIKKTEATFTETNNSNFEKLYTTAMQNKKKIIDVININNQLRNEGDNDKNNLNEELNKLKKDVIKKLKFNYKNIYVNKNTDILLELIKGTVTKKTGKIAKLNKLGFSDLVSKRLEFMENINNINNHLDCIKQGGERVSLGELPNKGTIILEVKIVTLSPEYVYKQGSVFNRTNIALFRDLVKKISTFSARSFSEINKYFSHIEKNTDGNIFISEVIKKEVNILKEYKNTSEAYTPSEGEKAILSISGLLENTKFDCYLFDEIERGLGNKYISDYLIPKLDNLRNQNKLIVLSTHNANIATNTLPSQCIYCDFKDDNSNGYFYGNMYSGELVGSLDPSEILNWEDKALDHL